MRRIDQLTDEEDAEMRVIAEVLKERFSTENSGLGILVRGGKNEGEKNEKNEGEEFLQLESEYKRREEADELMEESTGDNDMDSIFDEELENILEGG